MRLSYIFLAPKAAPATISRLMPPSTGTQGGGQHVGAPPVVVVGGGGGEPAKIGEQSNREQASIKTRIAGILKASKVRK